MSALSWVGWCTVAGSGRLKAEMSTVKRAWKICIEAQTKAAKTFWEATTQAREAHDETVAQAMRIYEEVLSQAEKEAE